MDDKAFPHRGRYAAFLVESEEDAHGIVKAVLKVAESKVKKLPHTIDTPDIGDFDAMAWFLETHLGLWVAFRVPDSSRDLQDKHYGIILDGYKESARKALAVLLGTRLDTLGVEVRVKAQIGLYGLVWADYGDGKWIDYRTGGVLRTDAWYFGGCKNA